MLIERLPLLNFTAILHWHTSFFGQIDIFLLAKQSIILFLICVCTHSIYIYFLKLCILKTNFAFHSFFQGQLSNTYQPSENGDKYYLYHFWYLRSERSYYIVNDQILTRAIVKTNYNGLWKIRNEYFKLSENFLKNETLFSSDSPLEFFSDAWNRSDLNLNKNNIYL